MKIIHTSDWHIGQVFNFHYDRQEEHQFFFDQLKKIIEEESPDALLVSGDVFDKSTPGNTSMRFFYDNILELVKAAPDTTFVITSGNHDSSSRLETDNGVWKLHNAHLVGAVEREDDTYLFDKHIIELKDKGFIVAVPYLQGYNSDFYNLILDEVEKRNSDNLPVILMAHTTIGDSDFGSHETSNFNGLLSVGGINCLKLSAINDKYDYLALGHIHTPQTLANGKARYCGSPVQINFKESFQHSVSLVSVGEHGEKPVIKELPLKPLKRFYTIPANPKPLDEALKTLQLNLPEEPGYVQLNILADGPLLADTENRIRNVLESNKDLLYCEFKVTRPDNNTDDVRTMPDLSLSSFKEKDPVSIATNYFETVYKHEMDESLVKLLQSVVQEVRNEISK